MPRISVNITGAYGNSHANRIVADGGDILVAGWGHSGTNTVAVVAAYSATNGTLDASFGTAGTTTVSIAGGSFYATSLVVQSDGKIVLAGPGNTSGGNVDFVLARLDTDGSLDTTFGSGGDDGIVMTDFGDGGGDVPTALELLAGDKLLEVGGTAQTSEYHSEWAMAQFNADGTPDTTFGSAGTELINVGFAGGDTITAATVQYSGTNSVIYVVGETKYDDLTVLRRLADGAADTSFGTAGEAVASFGGYGLGTAEAFGVAVDSSGNVIVAGSVDVGSANEVAIARFTSGGALDDTFGTDGKLTDTVGASDATVTSVALTSGGYIVVAGEANNSSFLVAEYDPADTYATTTTDADYTVVQRFIYTPYGQATVLNADWTPSTSTFGADTNGWIYGFQGGRYDPVSGKINFQHRDYDAATGTWLEADPMGYVNGGDMYQFGESSPISLVDPGGFQSIFPGDPVWPPGPADGPIIGVGPVPLRPEPTTIGTKIGSVVAGRIARGVLLPIGTNAALSHWNTLHINDDSGEMTTLNNYQMEAYYRYLVNQHGTIGPNWTTIIAPLASAKAAVGQFDTGSRLFGSAGWWLGGSNDVTAQGSLEARCSSGNIYIRNVNFQWTWYDRIHARSFMQGWMDARNNMIEWLVEGTADLFMDKLLDADFPIQITWKDERWWRSDKGHGIEAAPGPAPAK